MEQPQPGAPLGSGAVSTRTCSAGAVPAPLLLRCRAQDKAGALRGLGYKHDLSAGTLFLGLSWGGHSPHALQV